MGKEEQKSATFGQMIRAALGGDLCDGVQAHAQGGNFRLPLSRLAVISAENVGQSRERILDGVEWLRGDSDASPILARLNIVPTPVTRGKLAIGSILPGTSMQPESGTSALGRGTSFPASPATGDLYRFLSDTTGIVAVDEAGAALTEAEADQTYRYNGTAWQRQAAVFAEHNYSLSSVVESKSEISLELATQTSDSLLDDVLEAHRLGIADTLLAQVLGGGATGNDLNGVVNSTSIGAGSYPLADRGSDEAFTSAEIAVEDGGGRSEFMAWGLGSDLSTSARTVAIEPGGSRRVEERGALTLSGTPAQRITEGLAGTTGLIGDWQTVAVPVLSELLVVVDRITIPGFVRITSRLPIASPIVTHPAAVYALTQA